MNSVEKQIHNYIVDKLGVNGDIVNNSSSFTDDLGADSLDVFELFTGIEKEFDINIPDEEAEKIKTVGALNNYILKHITVGNEK